MFGRRKDRVRERLGDCFTTWTPFAFEHLIKRLLEEIDYHNVEVTVASGDGSVDVVVDIELGITCRITKTRCSRPSAQSESERSF